LTSTSTYNLACTGTGGTINQSVTVTVTAVPPPTVTFTASPTSVASGGTSTLTWSSTNATSCTASGAWSGAQALTGSQSTGPLTSSSTYTLSCTGAGGTTNQSVTVTITVTGAVPTFSRVDIDSNSPNNPWGKAVGDLNGDGLVDIVVGGANGPIYWYQSPGPSWSTWVRRTISSGGATESGSATGDVDGDGDIDVVVGTTWYENSGSGTSWTARALPASQQGITHDILIYDINNDGRNDIVMRGETQATVYVFLHGASTNLWTEFTLNPGKGLNGLDIADVDGDYNADIVVGGVWMKNPGAGSIANSGAWIAYTFTGSWPEKASVKVIDMDGDARPDIVLGVSEELGNLSWFKAPDDPRVGVWTENQVATGLNGIHTFVVADVDRDGLLDMAASELYSPGRLILYLNKGSSWQANTLGIDHLHNLNAADFDNDGDLDFVGAAAFGVVPVIVYRNTSPAPAKRVLIFSKTESGSFRHASIPTGIAAITQLGNNNGFSVDATENSATFTPGQLSVYRAIIFLNPSGPILDSSQRLAFQQFIRQGGGFVGIHNASAYVLEDWNWYTKLVGARYASEISAQTMTLSVVDGTHISTQGLPNPWTTTFEAYNFDVNPKVNGVHVLLNLNDTTVSGGTMGADHPFSWYRHYDGGRSWYSVGGANVAEYSDTNWMNHVLGGIRYAGAF
jgi:type 1 glutamine amidotransferase